MSPGLLWAGPAGAVEVFGSLALVLGVLTHPAALAVAVFMAVAVAVSVHLPQWFFWTESGTEFPLMWGLLALAICFCGGGIRRSVKSVRHSSNMDNQLNRVSTEPGVAHTAL